MCTSAFYLFCLYVGQDEVFTFSLERRESKKQENIDGHKNMKTFTVEKFGLRKKIKERERLKLM